MYAFAKATGNLYDTAQKLHSGCFTPTVIIIILQTFGFLQMAGTELSGEQCLQRDTHIHIQGVPVFTNLQPGYEC